MLRTVAVEPSVAVEERSRHWGTAERMEEAVAGLAVAIAEEALAD